MLDIDMKVVADMTDFLSSLFFSFLFNFLNGSVLSSLLQTDFLQTNKKNMMIPLLQFKMLIIPKKVSKADWQISGVSWFL